MILFFQRAAGGEIAAEHGNAEWTSEGERKSESRVCKPEQRLSVIKGRRMNVRNERARFNICAKPGGTAGIFLEELLLSQRSQSVVVAAGGSFILRFFDPRR